MKMAAAEALYNTTNGASFSIFSTAALTAHPTHLQKDIRIPHLLSLISDLSRNGKVLGINQINRAEQKEYGPGNYTPVIGVTYWTFRLMIGAGMLMLAVALAGLIQQRRRALERSRWFARFALLGVALPILANWTGWIFTEMGRQPWVVFGLFGTAQANSPNVSTTDIVITLAGYIVIYGVLIVIGGWLMLREIAHGPEAAPDPDAPEPSSSAPPRAGAGLLRTGALRCLTIPASCRSCGSSSSACCGLATSYSRALTSASACSSASSAATRPTSG
jgi:cytochrome d ubiquinol oxidase subunit I